MKLLTTFLLSILLCGFANAQKVFIYSDDPTFLFKVNIDSVLSGDGVNYDCLIKNITIYNKSSNKDVQTIVPAENYFFCTLPKEQILQINDVNFDGHTDFMLIQFNPASPNIPYYYYVFNNANQQFQRDTSLEIIASPDFDQKKQLITSYWRSSTTDFGTSTFKYINGTITLIEEIATAMDSNHPDQLITTKKKLVKGEMKLIKRSVEKVKL